MKKNLLLTLAFAGLALAAQAQVLQIGFEENEAKGKYTTADSTQFAGFFADHINLQSDDVWDEASTEAHTGTYALEANNANTFVGNTWHRGFKIRNVNLENATSYRISYWVKADATYEAADGTKGNTGIKNSLSIGFENVEAPIVSPSGKEYYYNYTSGMNGEWRHIRNVTFFTSKENQDLYFSNYSKNIKEITADGDTIRFSDGMTGFADQYFITINMYSPGIYYLDDIVLEKATMAGCDFNDYAIRVDFGYPTNIDDLAKAAGGSVSFDPSCVTVTVNGSEVKADYLEGKEDGYMYIFFEETSLSPSDVVTVSFTPSSDFPVVYDTDRRPSTDVESEMVVLAFSNEAADYSDNIEEIPDAWTAPELVSTVPENNSFELNAATLTQLVFTYDKDIDLSSTSVVLSQNGKNTDLTDGISAEGAVLTIPVSITADGEYTVTVSGVASLFGETTVDDQSITFSVGPDNDDSSSEVVYAPDFGETAAGTFPIGWLANDNGTIHQYGLNEDGSVWNYNWGSTPGGGGCRTYTSFSGDFTTAIYWRNSGSLGTCTYGEQVKDWILEDGTIDPAMPENIALYLDARKYKLEFRNIAWKSEPYYNFSLEDLNGNVIAQFTDILAYPNVEGNASATVTGSKLMETTFTVPEAGYYMLKFSSTQNWAEFLLAGVRLVTMPSTAAYYKQLLNEALTTAKTSLEAASDASYDGTTKTSLTNEISTVESTTYTSPSEVEAEIARLNSLSSAMNARVENIDNFNVAVIEAMAAIEPLEGTKYEATETYKEAKAILDEYGNTDPSSIEDDVLAVVSPQIVSAAAKLANVQTCTDRLTWRIYKANQTAGIIGTNNPSATDAGWAAVTDDYDVADAINKANMNRLYEIIINDGVIADTLKTTLTDDQTGAEVSVGVEMTGLIKNPKFYNILSENVALYDNAIPGWLVDQEDTSGNTLHYNGNVATEEEPVTDVMANNWKADYKLYQVVENVPVGVYDIELDCRTSAGYNGYTTNEAGESIPDKYIFVEADGKTYRQAFAEGGWGTHTCVVKNVEIKNGSFTFGAIEKYLSGGANTTAEDGTVTESNWNTNTFVDNARLFFVAPSEDFDYVTAVESIKSDVELNAVRYEYYTVSGARVATAQKGINIVKMYDANGNSVTKKVLVK